MGRRGFLACARNPQKERWRIRRRRSAKYKEERYQLKNKIKIKKNELELIAEYKDSPIGSLISPPLIGKPQRITNPFGIINALSFNKTLVNKNRTFKDLGEDVSSLTTLLDEKMFLFLELYKLDQDDFYEDQINYLEKEIKDFVMVLEIVTTTQEVYTRKIEQVVLEVKDQISLQFQQMLTMFLTIFSLFVVSFLIKLTLKKYFSQNENYYMNNKIINFLSCCFCFLLCC